MKNMVIVLINFYKENELLQFIENYLLKQSVKNLSVVVVDNGSHDASIMQKISAIVNVSLLSPQKNLGYFGGAFAAYTHCIEEVKTTPDVFIVSNFDLSFDAFTFFQQVENACESCSAAVIGPAMESSLTGAPLNPMYLKRMSSEHINRLVFVTSSYPVYLFYQFLHYVKRALKSNGNSVTEQKQTVYAIHGSFLILKREFFERGGTLNYGSFLYGEEIFVAEQCRKLGMDICMVPTLKVIHHEHATTGRIKSRRHMKWLNESMRYLRERYFHG